MNRQPEEKNSQWMNYVVSLALVMAIAAILITIQGSSPAEAFGALIKGAVGSTSAISSSIRWSTPVLIATIALTLTLMSVGDRLLLYAVDSFGLPRFWAVLWAKLRFPVAAVAGYFALFFLYALSQDGRQPWRNIWPGTMAALGAWLALNWLYSTYVENFADYSLLYGSIGTAIALLIWLYMTAVTLIMGAELNATLISLRKDRAIFESRRPPLYFTGEMLYNILWVRKPLERMESNGIYERKTDGIRPAAGAGGPEYPEGAAAGDLLACGVRLFRPSLCGGGLSGRLPGGGDELGRR